MQTTTNRILSIIFLLVLASSFILGTQVTTTHSERITPNTGSIKLAVKPKRLPTKPLPDFSHIYNTQEKKQQFFSYLMPIVKQVNNEVLVERKNISTLSQKSSLTNRDKTYLNKLAKKYRVKTSLDNHAKFFQRLLIKVDQIPPSLVLAQAANESAWGTSRFAVEGNNLFGQWCFAKGCGLVPVRRDGDASHEVAKFSSVFHSVESYILNLNRHAQYSDLRAIRFRLRSNEQPINGIQLANGLLGYSERGQEYVNEIQSMIRFNNLASFDKNS
ncbi:glucosaminidase domain-containing protein [Alkalimarinus sediminis]|uniref:Glucosaminidase domain-containing protein n=1 Tax=Alkalimarinus sediminis TaxID=1632866 RepID=A0A9E8HHI9_9ALTE|nr:glucosaminidase domain-containing protein [Alkalimarinus sediminis]UZW73467.1 glucosaminidase domain-containing protein [Alkalimarinus sediminis]